MGVEPWSEAYREARERALGYVGTDLLLLGLTRADGPAGEVLRELGATPERVLDLLDRFGWYPADNVDEMRREWPTPTPAVEQARGRAEGIAIGLGKEERQVDLLLALAYDRHGVHQGTLAQLRIDGAGIVAALAARGLQVPPIRPPPRPQPHNVMLVLPDEQHHVVVEALGKATVADRERFFDAYGSAHWGTNGMKDRPGYSFITATNDLGLREFAIDALAAAGYPPPPEDAWERREEI